MTGRPARRNLLAGGLGSVLSPPAVFAASPSPLVQTSAGPVIGVSQSGIQVFKGLRYGATTRARRFRPPVSPDPWTKPWLADRFGPACPQSHSDEPTSEDCLFLNVWTPEASVNGHRPVLVYIHGGEYSHGSGSSPLYDGALLAREQDLVVVTLNHRLNIFGHLALGLISGDAQRQSGNVGILDLILALNWVRKEIAAFGGDPACVTLVGQSGGGAKIATLMAMPAARGLFHRAMTMSGQQVTASGPQIADRRARVVLDRLGVAPGSLADLASFPTEQLIEASQAPDPTLPGSLYFGPVVDGVALPRHPFWPVAPAQSRRIPMIIGGTRDEVRIFFRSEKDRIAALGWETMTSRLGRELRIDCDPRDVVALYRRLRPEATPEDIFYSAVTDSRSWRGAVLEAEVRVACEAPTYVYQVDFGSPLEGGALKACHMIDIPLIFGTTNVPGALSGDGPDARALSRRMRDMLGRFAWTGNPNGHGLPLWAPYDLQRRSTLVFDAWPRLLDDPRSAERRFFSAFPFIQRGTI